MIRFFLPLLLLSTFAAAQTVGQYELRKRGASGFTSYGVTLSNGQVIGQTAGIPAAITPFGGAFSDLSGKPTTLSGYGITNALVTTNNLSDLTSAATARTNLGLGTAATLATSTGGNYTTDGGKVMIFGSFGEADISRALTIHRINSGGWLPGVLQLEAADNVQAVISPSDGMGSFQTFTLPTVGGTLIGTGNLTAITTVGTITSGTWNGTAIGLGYLAQGGATSGQVLSWNGTTWAPAAGGGGITIGSTTITSGSTTRVLYNNGGVVGEYTISGTGNVAMTTSPTFTTPALGTPSALVLTNATGLPAASVIAGSMGSGNFTFSATVFAGSFKGSSAGSSIDYDQAGFWISGNTSGKGYWFGNNQRLTNLAAAKTMLVGVTTTTAQGLHVINTYTNDTSYESLVLDWSGNVGRVGTQKGSGGGSAREMILVYDSTEKARVSSSGFTIGSGGSAISKVLTATATLDFADTAPQATTDLTITVTGAVDGNVVVLGIVNASHPAGSCDFRAWVSAADTVTVRFMNNNLIGNINPASGTFRATVIQH